jgi:AcrR family transcriptional regulator
LQNDKTTKEKILEAALTEFGTKGYKNASTNQIYPVAHVSKGAIFKIFGSKSNLFYEVFSLSLSKMVEALNSIQLETYNDLSKINTDVFDRMIAVMLWKMEYAKKHPFETAVMMEGISDPPKAIQQLIITHVNDLKKLSMNIFFDEIPMDNIREDISKEQFRENIEISLAGIQAYYINQKIDLGYLEKIREKSILYLKTVMKGMEKNND